jgi:kallikrein
METELYAYQELKVDRIVFHPGFDIEKGARGNLWNDIALVKTDKPFSLAPHVDTICLPRPGQAFHGSLCAATGWGKDRFGLDFQDFFYLLSFVSGDAGRPQILLKEVWMKVVEWNNCQEKLRETKLGQFFVLDKSFLCAGGEVDIDMCTVRIFQQIDYHHVSSYL